MEEYLFPGIDGGSTLDGMNRLTDATEGDWDNVDEEIDSKARQELYTFDQVGNFNFFKCDLDGDGSFTGTDEWDDDRGHNDVNPTRQHHDHFPQFVESDRLLGSRLWQWHAFLRDCR